MLKSHFSTFLVFTTLGCCGDIAVRRSTLLHITPAELNYKSHFRFTYLFTFSDPWRITWRFGAATSLHFHPGFKMVYSANYISEIAAGARRLGGCTTDQDSRVGGNGIPRLLFIKTLFLFKLKFQFFSNPKRD